MPKVAKELGPLDVKRLIQRQREKTEAHAVGGANGLYLQVTPSCAASWLLRIKVGKLRREIGLGSFQDVTLSQARQKARETRARIANGLDPVEERRAIKAALIAAQKALELEELRSLTFAQAVQGCLDSRLKGFQNAKHRDQWRNTLETYAVPSLGSMRVDEIQARDVKRALQPIWDEKPVTAQRVRGRIEAVLSWATVEGHRTGENPARWKGNLEELLAVVPKSALVRNQPALRIDDAPRWYAELIKRDGMGARALQFTALVAARSGDVRGATWAEIDLERALWVIPAKRMKMKREHRVPLSGAAVALLEALPRFQGQELVFPAIRGGLLSDMTLSATMRRIHASDIENGSSGFFDRVSHAPAVPHGLRSTFRDWVAERTDYPGEMAEAALAHRISNATEAAYPRGDMIEKRREMMAEWAYFLGNEF